MRVIEKGGYRIWHREGTTDEAVIRQILEEKLYLAGMPEYVPGPRQTVLDIGAHIGAFAALISPQIEGGRIFALEPSLESFELLERNVRENALANVIPCRVALTDRMGETTLWHDERQGNWGHSIVRALSNRGETVATDTLQGFFARHRIETCDLMKFNCEGAEFSIILSTPAEVLQRIQQMVILYHMDLATGHDYRQLMAHLRRAGFYVERRRVNRGGQRGWLIALRTTRRHALVLRMGAWERAARAFLWRLYSAAYWAKEGILRTIRGR
jgi:FkbM family methyltransferase